MALTRAMLKGMGLTEEQVGAIIEEHTTVTDALKADVKKYKADSDKLSSVQKELDELKSGSEDWQAKYNKEHNDFEDYKKQIAGKEETDKIKSAYKKLLADNGVADRHIDAIIKVTDFSGMKLDKEGKLDGTEKLTESIKSEWSGFITSKGTKGASVDTPPANSKATMTKDQIMNIKDTTERQKAIAENIELFN